MASWVPGPEELEGIWETLGSKTSWLVPVSQDVRWLPLKGDLAAGFSPGKQLTWPDMQALQIAETLFWATNCSNNGPCSGL